MEYLIEPLEVGYEIELWSDTIECSLIQIECKPTGCGFYKQPATPE
ncbi:hypothetical protein KAU34_08430 [candidate division WOR-3 bacterium]|nr:hypothetical protein [candidate division WOR-3 bacterium]